MAEVYNNPVNVEIINMTNSWAGQIGIYADGYATKADRAAKKNYNPLNDRRRMALSYTKNGVRTGIPKGVWKDYIKMTKHIKDSNEVIKAIKSLAEKDYGGKINFAKPFAEFETRAMGLRAGMRLLMGPGYLGAATPINTVDGIVRKFAPNFENNTQAYVNAVMGKFKKVEGYENFDGTITEKEVPMLLKFMLQHENDKKDGLHEYYINDDALKNDWPVAAWCAKGNYTQDKNDKFCRDGYKQSLSAKNKKKEVDSLKAGDGKNNTGGSDLPSNDDILKEYMPKIKSHTYEF